MDEHKTTPQHLDGNAVAARIKASISVHFLVLSLFIVGGFFLSMYTDHSSEAEREISNLRTELTKMNLDLVAARLEANKMTVACLSHSLGTTALPATAVGSPSSKDPIPYVLTPHQPIATINTTIPSMPSALAPHTGKGK